jgi:hypothetical protein
MNPIEKYFNAEKYESVLFVLVGVVAFALIQIIVGGSVYFRSPKYLQHLN